MNTGIHKCLNCGSDVTGNFCGNCGEKVHNEQDKKIAHLFEEVLHFITHFEGKFFTSVRTMFRHPGLMSFDYCRGLRKKYFRPVSLYILLVIVYLIFPMFKALNLTLEGHMSQKFYSVVSQRMLKEKQESTGLDYNSIKVKFETESGKVSKILLLITLPLCALILWGLFPGKKKFFFDHFILSAEINSMFLMILFLILPLISNFFYWFINPAVFNFLFAESNILFISTAVLFSFGFVAFKRFYNAGFWSLLFKSALFSFGQLMVFLVIYRFLLFVTVMSII